MANLARFTIDGSAPTDGDGDPGYDATAGQVLDLALETPSLDVLHATFAVYDPAISSSPQKSLSAPNLTFAVSGTSTRVITDPATVVQITMPGSGTHSYAIRCTVQTAFATYVFEREVVLRSASNLRKTIPAETTHYEARGWSDEQNRMVDAIAGLTPGGGASDPKVNVVTASIVANQNDLTPTGWAAAFASPSVGVVFRFTTDASRDITGLAAPPTPASGWAMPVTLINAGSNPAVLKHQTASSTAANRFLNQGALDITLQGDDTLRLVYDHTSSRWRAL